MAGMALPRKPRRELPEDASLRDLMLWTDRRRAQARRRMAFPPSRDDAAPQTGEAPGTVVDLQRPTDDLMRFTIVRPKGFTFRPGDSVRLDMAGVRRRYTIVSAPHEPHLEFFVELVPGGRMSGHLATLRPGARITVAGPAKGGLALDPKARRHLMLATVTGVNPFVSILRDAVHGGRTSTPCVLVHGASHHDEFGYRAELEALAAARPDLLTYRPTVSRPDDPRNRGWRGATGRVDAHIDDLRARLALSPADTAVYACGNPAMIDGVRGRLGDLGYRVHSESYF